MIIYLFIHFIFGIFAYMRINADNHYIEAHTTYFEIAACMFLSYIIFIAGLWIYLSELNQSEAKFFKLIRA